MRPNDPPQPLATLMVATCNVLNLANPGRMFYENQDPYSAAEFERKLTWLGERLRMLNADVLAVQEVWDEAAFKAAAACATTLWPSPVLRTTPGAMAHKAHPAWALPRGSRWRPCSRFLTFPRDSR